ncbi:MAG: LacI family DNA-binding transcriptional regulator [Deltaproteobacteria bacterium]|nr:LacI family DNA-binding transcriptional regulator [Deltaproteobacteria bacterium]
MSTIRDVARIAAVSTATVSRVINSPEVVSPETRNRVAKAMKACRYQYNALARGFVTQQSYTLGLIVPSITNPIFAESIRGVQDFAHREGYQALLGNSDYEYAKEARLCEVLRERQVEGLIITTTKLRGKVLRDLLDDHFPLVLLYSTVRKGPISAVGVDNFRGGYSATEHLIHLGHRRIAMLAGRFSFSDKSLHRWHGYKKCLRDHRIPYDPALVLQTQYALENGREGIKALLALEQPPTAVFCSNDFMAIGAMQGAREVGVALPEGLSIVGFDDMAIASYINPGLTTIRQPAYEMGRLGAEILLSQIKRRDGRPIHKILETGIVVRESTAGLTVCEPKRNSSLTSGKHV